MGRSKLLRFQANAISKNLIEEGKPWYKNTKGKWHKYFDNKHDLILELGCGRGEYTTGLANIFPNKNFVGVDMKGARLWKGSSVAESLGYSHVAFLRAQIQNLEQFFDKGEVSEIWITFPDPRPKDNEEKLRLTNKRFLSIYKEILQPGGIVNFKTDNRPLFDYSLEVLQSKEILIQNLEYTFDLYQSEMLAAHYNIKTTFENKFLSKDVKINYMRFTF